MFTSVSRRRMALLLLLPLAVSAQEKPIRCEVCGNRLPRNYWVLNGKYCCSQVCVNQLYPQCAVCGKSIRGTYFTRDGKKLCSQACADTLLPKCEICKAPIRDGYSVTRHQYCADCVKNKPACFSCGLPAAHAEILPDGRALCRHCLRWAVKKPDHAQRNFDIALRYLQAWTSIEIESVPKLQLISLDRINRLSADLRQTDSPVSVRGLYSRQVQVTSRPVLGLWSEQTTEEHETIFIVDYLHDQVFRTAAVHELMHDLIHEKFQRLEKAPRWVQEGICQQVAAAYCRRRNYMDILYTIEECEDPDYGDGYRWINKQTGFRGWPALKHWMETVDLSTLPETAPR